MGATFVSSGSQTGASRFDAEKSTYVCPPLPLTPTWKCPPVIPAELTTGATVKVNVAGALVTEGKEFPDNSLIVGVPAKVVRTLDAAAVARLKASADGYVRNARRFAGGLEPA